MPLGVNIIPGIITFMITFYLIRHGTKEAIPFDPPLTAVGIKQAEATAKHLMDIPFKAIITSPKKRTQQTAQIIAAKLEIPVTINDVLQERLEWESNQSFDEFLTEWNKTDLDRTYTPLQGKGSKENGGKVKKLLEELAQEYIDGNILIVSHGGTIGDILRAVFNEDQLEHVVEPKSQARFIDLQECSITIIEKEHEKYNLVKMNNISHLSIPLI